MTIIIVLYKLTVLQLWERDCEKYY